MKSFTVRRPGGAKMRPPHAAKPIKTEEVFYSDSDPITCAEVRDSLVNHDGYEADIIVTRRVERKTYAYEPTRAK
jgi:hypothetical protein